jgi:hypothetical protein
MKRIIRERILSLTEDGDCPPPMKAEVAMNELCRYFLGEDWRDMPFSAEQIITEIVYEIETSHKPKVKIRICSNCGKYFIPVTRNDEIYCDNRNPNGKTCKEIGYENKVKKDAVLSAYRRIYQTQNARKQRYHIKNDKFRRWTEFAKEKLGECQAGKITLDEMIESIVKDDWIM